MTAAVRDQQLTVVGAVVYNKLYTDTVHVCLRHRSPRISEYAEEKRTEQFICTQRK